MSVQNNTEIYMQVISKYTTNRMTVTTNQYGFDTCIKSIILLHIMQHEAITLQSKEETKIQNDNNAEILCQYFQATKISSSYNTTPNFLVVTLSRDLLDTVDRHLDLRPEHNIRPELLCS